MIEEIKPLIKKLTIFAKNRLGFQNPPRLFLKKDKQNSKSILGKTAHYDPENSSITVFILNRHPKDILRSYCHELVHHCQNERGDLTPEKIKTLNKNYAQENDHMRKMEQEAYLEGNMCFRDFEDGLMDKEKYIMKIAESKFLKENKTMTTKITKQFLKEKIKEILQNQIIGENNTDQENSQEIEEENGSATTVAPSHYCIHHGGVQHEGAIHQGEAIGHNWNEELGKVTHYDMKLSDGTILEDVAAEDILVTKASLAEGSYTLVGECSHKKHDIKKKKKSTKLKNPKKADLDKDGELSSYEKRRGQAIEKSMAAEQINTPEGEGTLYEERFTPRNTRLFDKLLKEWTK
ncbi:MAG: hypothetical protein CMF52_07070 [Legionellales bacterium]|nr:hypothetical protein [Legionellales bacterium]